MKNTPDARVDDRLRSELADALVHRQETLARQHDQLSVELADAADDNDLDADATQAIRTNLETAATALADTERALARVRHDDFGVCDTCQAVIASERLRVLPETTRCTACASVP